MMTGAMSRLATVVLLSWCAFGLAAHTPAWSATHDYDRAGNIKSITTHEATEQFVYDQLGRLRSGTAGPGRVQEYAYDSFGNILSITTDGSTSTTLRPCVDATTDRMSRSGADCNVVGVYDLAGRMTRHLSTNTFTYDALDRVRESTVDDVRNVYLYDAHDERIAAYTRTDTELLPPLDAARAPFGHGAFAYSAGIARPASGGAIRVEHITQLREVLR